MSDLDVQLKYKNKNGGHDNIYPKTKSKLIQMDNGKNIETVLSDVEVSYQTVIDEITNKDIISAPEIIASHVDSKGETHPNLKTRLDNFELSTTAQLQHNKQVLSGIIQYDIRDFEGDTLNEKWDNMRKDFVSFRSKEIVIPMPIVGEKGTVLTPNGWRWALSAPLKFNDTCNNMKVFVYDEIVAKNAIPQALLFDDVKKPEDVDFPLGIKIRGFSQNGATIGNAIEVRSGARINFFGQTLINDCNIGVLIGGNAQSAPASATFDQLSIGFPSESGIIVNGNAFDAYIDVNRVVTQIFQSPNKDSVLLTGKVVDARFNSITYNTDIAKDGYTTYNAGCVIRVKGQLNKVIKDITIGNIFASNATEGIIVENEGNADTVIGVYVDQVRISPGDAIGVRISNVMNVIIERVGIFNTVIIESSAVNCSVGKSSKKPYNNNSRTSTINNVINDNSLTFFEKPSYSSGFIGDKIINTSSKAIYMRVNDNNEESDFMRIDSQMIVPVVTTLPTATFQLRGKLVMLWNSGVVSDGVYICVRRDNGAYAWFNIITNSF